MSGPVAQEKQGIYVISIIGASLKKIRDDAHDAHLSPDGSQIVFTSVDNDAISIMNADGSGAHQFLKADEGTRFYGPTFICDGKRVAYLRISSPGGQTKQIAESRSLQGDDPVVLLDDPDLIDATFNQAARFIYSDSEPIPHERDSNLWELDYDKQTGRPKGTPVRLTDWTGFTFLYPSISNDGKHFAFLNQRDQSAVFLGELAANGDELKNPQRLTLNDKYNWATGWMPDSQGVLFYSNVNGNFDIYKQGFAERTPQAVVTGGHQKWAPQLSPDGKWIVYLQFARTAGKRAMDSGKLMRVATTGGAPEFVMDVTVMRPARQPDALSTVAGLPSFHCPKNPGALCVVAERKDQEIVFSSFDPMQGRKAEITHVPFRRGNWDISPDGTRLAVAQFSYTKGEINIIPLNGGARQTITAGPWAEITNLAWAADGKSLFLNSFSSRGTAIVHLGLDGHAKLLYKQGWEIFSLSVSPDGKYLSFGPDIYDSNAWTVGSFPAK